MKKSILHLTVALLLVFGLVQVAAAGMGWEGGPPLLNSEKWVNPVEALDLTDQQINAILEINQNSFEQTRELRIQLMDSMYELKQVRLQKNPDQAQVNAKIKEINELQEKIHTISQQSRELYQALLSDEQKNKLQELRCKRGCGFRGGSAAGNEQ